MSSKAIITRNLKRFVGILVISMCIMLSWETTAYAADSDVKVYFLSVGQGDAQLVESNGKYLLIDCGPKSAGPTVAAFLKKKNITHLDYVIATHPHEDHIGGFLTVFQEVTVGTLYMNNVTHTTNTYKNFMNLIWSKNITRRNPFIGGTFELGSATVQFISPKSFYYEILNNYSIVARVTNGENSFLFTGDAEELAEQEMVQSGYLKKTDVLKVAHHSSKTSTIQEFVDIVDPTFSVIECGLNNVHGFPKKVTLAKLVYSNVYRTDTQGHITFKSDGKKITVDKNPAIPAKSKDSSGDLKTLYNFKLKSSMDGIKLLNTNKANDYSLTSTKNETFSFTASYGVSSKKKTEHMLVDAGKPFDEKGKWTNGANVEILNDFKGRIYVRYTNAVGNTVIKKTTGFCVDTSPPEACKVTSDNKELKYESVNAKTTYTNMSKVPLTLTFSADFGVSGKSKIEYMLVEKGEEYDKNGEWTNGSQVTLPDQFVGCVYVKYTDKAGNVTIRKTTGVLIDTKAPNECEIESNVEGISLVNQSQKIDYNTVFDRRVVISFKANYGLSGKRRVQYMLVASDAKYNKNGKWTTANSVTIPVGFEGCVYIRFIDKAGNETIKKTTGFSIQ